MVCLNQYKTQEKPAYLTDFNIISPRKIKQNKIGIYFIMSRSPPQFSTKDLI